MDRFVWFVLLVVISHLVTEFTRVTGHTRGPRQDVVMVNDSSTQPLKVQNQVLYPGQEYGLYEQQNQQYYNDNNLYSNYANNKNYNNANTNSNNKHNFLSSLFNRFTKSNNNRNEQEQSELSSSVNSKNNLLNLPPSDQGDGKTFSFRPLIDSIFEIPISTLRAVNDLVGRLTGAYLQPQPQNQQQQNQQQQQQPPTNYFYYPSYPLTNSYYGLQRTTGAIQPKTQFEMLNEKRPTTEKITVKAAAAAVAAKPTVNSTTISRKSSL